MPKIINLKSLACALTMVLFSSVCSAQIYVNIDDDVPYDQVKAVNKTIELMEAAVPKSYGVDLTSDVTVNVYAREKSGQSDSSGNSKPGQVIVWIGSDDSPYKAAFLTAHELIHQYQMELVGNETLNLNMWLTEGMADYFGVAFADLYDGESQFKSFASSAIKKTKGKALDLSWIEKKTPWKAAYDKGLPVYAKADTGVMYLAKVYSPKKLWTFLQNIKETKNTDAAMLLTYGLSEKKLEEYIEH